MKWECQIMEISIEAIERVAVLRVRRLADCLLDLREDR